MLVIVLLVSFFLLLFIGVPISFALSISSFTAVMTTGAIPVINLVQKTFRAIDSFTLLAIPFFVFAGNVMARGGVSKRLTDMAATLVGRMPGGLAHVATLSSTFLARSPVPPPLLLPLSALLWCLRWKSGATIKPLPPLWSPPPVPSV